MRRFSQMAATHANVVDKSSVKVMWVPDGFEGDVVFRYRDTTV